MRKIKISTKTKMRIVIVFAVLIAATTFYLGRYNAFLFSNNNVPKPTVSLLDTVSDSEISQKNFLEDSEPRILQENIEIGKNYTILDCPDLLQNNESTCGVCAGLAVLEYFGITAYADNLAAQMKTNYKNGTEMEDIARVLKMNGLDTKMEQMTIEELKASICNKIPVIVLMQAYNPTGKYEKENSLKNSEWGHFVVAIGYGEGNIVFNDPEDYGRKYLSERQFKARWKGIDEYRGKKPTLLNNYGIVAIGKEPVVPTNSHKLKKMP